jgi:hypothetical protein
MEVKGLEECMAVAGHKKGNSLAVVDRTEAAVDRFGVVVDRMEVVG